MPHLPFPTSHFPGLLYFPLLPDRISRASTKDSLSTWPRLRRTPFPPPRPTHLRPDLRFPPHKTPCVRSVLRFSYEAQGREGDGRREALRILRRDGAVA